MSAADLPPYEPDRVIAAPFPERVRLVCRSFATASPNSVAVMALYWAKYFLVYIGGFLFFVCFDFADLSFASPVDRVFTAVAFHKAIAWSIFYELCGLGCGWGPMNARIKPMLLGARYYLRPGTTKMPLFPGVPILGAPTRGWLDVTLYAVNQLFLLRALVAPEVTPDLLLPAFVLIPIFGVLDKTLFLAARAEHYYVALVCLVVAQSDDLWIAGCKLVWSFIWFWAAMSKVNHHFPSVIMVMMNNGPFFPGFLKKRLFTNYPDDLRPSRFATFMAHMGTLTEISFPFLLFFTAHVLHAELATVAVLCLMTSFHGFIAINNPNGMPIEWNILMIFGGWFLFAFHPEPSILALGAMPGLLAFLLFCLFAVPCFGNFFPRYVSFLLSMRYYAGNWAYNIWLVKKGRVEKLNKLVKTAGTMREQLAVILEDPKQVEAALAMTCATRFMHLEGRPLFDALPHAVARMDDYEWLEGELVGGMIIGWNFGDGHLNGKQLFDAVQAQCEVEPGELRLVSVESQPLFGPKMAWKVYDAADGLLAEGETEIAKVRHLQPWPVGDCAEALVGNRAVG
jgi:hypothetical protein